MNSYNCMYAVKSLENPEINPAWPHCGYCYRPDLVEVNAEAPIDYVRDAGKIDPGDGTIFLGEYLAFLSTEWAWLKLNNQPTADTEEKLYLALEAIERLDMAGEEAYGMVPALDGFFIRHDVPFDFLISDGERNEKLGPDFAMVAGCLERMDPACDGGEIPGTPLWRAMSQDQVIGLIFGIRLLTHYVDENVEYKGEKLSPMAQELIHRIVKYVSTSDWIIKDPNGDGVCRGRNSSFYSWAIAKATNLITGKRYQNLISSTMGAPGWRVLSSFYSPNGIYGSKPKSIFAFELDGSDVNRNMMFKLASITGSWDDENLAFALIADGYELFDLVSANLWDEEPVISKEYFEKILLEAPKSGPKKFTAELYWEGFADEINALEQVKGWNSANRFSNPGSGEGAPDINGEGEYSGLDYMILFNLYRLKWYAEKGPGL